MKSKNGQHPLNHLTLYEYYFLKIQENIFLVYCNWRTSIVLWWVLPYINMNQPWAYICPLPPEPPSHFPPHPIPPGCHRAPALGSLRHISKSHWLSLLHMVMYMFQCYSLKSSHPLLLLCPKVCSLCLCLLCCPACRTVGTIFLDSIYRWCLSFSFWLSFTLYNRL